MIKRLGSEEYASLIATHAVCVNLEDVYIKGEPSSKSDASLIVAFSKNPDIITNPNQHGYDEEKDRYF